jgi:hypothetical protein
MYDMGYLIMIRNNGGTGLYIYYIILFVVILECILLVFFLVYCKQYAVWLTEAS